MTPYAKWRFVFWLLVALLVLAALFAAYEVWSDLRPANCCGAAACEVQKHHQFRRVRMSPEKRNE